MEDVDVLILGAGPAGLSAAYSLLKSGVRVAIVERTAVTGGLMRTVRKNGFTVDYGYKHLYSRIPEVHDFWKSLLGKDFIKYTPRIGMLFAKKILEKEKSFKGLRRGMPYSLLFWAIADLVKHRISRRQKPITSLQDFAYAKRGEKFTLIFTQGFDERIKGRRWNKLPVPEKLKEMNKQTGFVTQFLHDANEDRTKQAAWFHPAKGSGQIAEKLEMEIHRMGGKIYFESEVVNINEQEGQIVSLEAKKAGNTFSFAPRAVISSLPLETMSRLLGVNFKPASGEISFRRSVVLIYLFLNKPAPFPHTCIQVSDPNVQMGRVTNFSVFGGSMVPAGKGCICIEYFCSEASPVFKMSDKELLNLGITECENANLINAKDCFDHLIIKGRGADPATSWEDYITDPSRNEAYKKMEGCKNLYQVNRTGIDRSTYAGLMAAKAIVEKNKQEFILKTRPDIFNIWDIKKSEEEKFVRTP